MKTNDIKKVIDAGLANVQTTPQDVENIMNHIRESESRERKPRKMPLAVAIALALLLIGAVAVAAMSFKGAIVEILRIEEEEQIAEINNWSLEHKMEVVDLLVEAGTSFDMEMLESVYDDTLPDEEKSDLINEMLLKRFPPSGNYWSVTTFEMLFFEKGAPYTWTHEERVWFSEQTKPSMDGAGSWRYILPTAEDMSEEQAVEIAYAYFEDTYGLTRDCFDPTKEYASFMEVMVEDDNLEHHWEVKLILTIDEYDGAELTRSDVQLTIRENGTLYDICGPQIRTWEDDWYDIRFADDFWTIESLYSFQVEWKPIVEQLIRDGVRVGKELEYLITLHYGLPEEGDISLDTAREIARTTILALDNWTDELLSYYPRKEAYLIKDTNQYCIVYTLALLTSTEYSQTLWDMNINGEIPYSIRVCIDSKTGEVLEVYELIKNSSVVDAVGL